MRLLLLRHGQTTSNVSGALDTGPPGAGLTDLGRRQARAAARVLSGRTTDAIFVSNLQRTHETAAPLAASLGVDPTPYDGLREISAGRHEMASHREAVHDYLTTVIHWIEGDHDYRMPGGESGLEFLARYDDAVDGIVASGVQEAVVVSHGAAIRTWVACRAVDPHDERWAAYAHSPLQNTGAIEVELTRRGWDIVEWHGDPLGGHFLEDPDAEDPTADLLEGPTGH